MDRIYTLETKLEKCYDYASLYALEEDFNKVGLTIQPTISDKMVLCRIVDGKPLAENLATDFMFVGNRLLPETAIPERLLKCVVEFVKANGSEPASVEQSASKTWNDIPKLYGNFIVIESEEIRNLMQNMSIEEKPTPDHLLDAIKEWLGKE